MIRPILSVLVLAAVTGFGSGSAFAQASAAQLSTTPLIERAKFFGNPTKAGSQISPDGKHLSWIAPRDGVMNLWVAPLSDLSKAKPLTAETKRPIRAMFWAPDSKSVLFINDKGGDENFLLYGVNVASGEQKSLTPFEKTRVQVVGISNNVKDRILVAVNNRDPKWHDVHSLDLATGKLALVFQNDGYSSFLPDESLNLRIATKSNSAGGTDFHTVTDGKVAPTPYASVGMDDVQTTRPLGFTTDGKSLYWADSRGRNTAALLEQDLASGKTKVIAEDARADITSALPDTRTGRVQAYQLDYLTNEFIAVDPKIAADLAFLKKQAKGAFWINSRSEDGEKWIVVIDRVIEPSSTFLYERKGKRLTKLYTSRPELEGAPLVPMLPKEIKSRDGMTMVSYLTMPKSAGDKTNAPVPMVLLVHGGPWARDGYGYNSVHQWLANRGYAVLSVNFRGSTGFGKKFISAGDMQWGRKMHDDLLDAVTWAVAEGITTRDKVAIMGASYGGYATLAGLAFTPDQFACGVDIVGPSNLFTLLSTVPPYWESLKQRFYKRIGDPTTEAGKAVLKERSPLYSADKITRPLLIGQGANDPRVNVAESDQIVAAMSAKNIPVTYVVFPDEGHGFARPANNIAFMAVTENFLGKCLGGRAEPIGASLKASSAQVKHGAEFSPGLKEAM
ncbi:S9 family peptidase [Massilia psychrophila]|uniref:S9 family peptidase n=1 Tax=Massilia psychrophila TaxID=1603353 RepID=A0A2G8T189_9BURK|nr:S9 family peptidase [Massilia psychrophila]PIL39801.1 S9 family peptidase [Massilia psychrophila]GGE63102.1 peptidase S9 [Massilia psychrophila]